MIRFEWDEKKNDLLKTSRGVSFEDVLQKITEGELVDVLVNTKHSGQIVYVVRLNGYIHCVPAVARRDCIRLITIYPSRKLHGKYRENY